MPSIFRTAAVGGALVLVTTLLAPAAHAAPLRFGKPVALESFSPLRTATSTVYSRGSASNEWSAEPVIKVDRDGVIYIAGTCCVVASSPVWASYDGGKTFEELESPGKVREWGIGAEGDIAVDDEGRMYFVDTYVPGMLTTRWSDGGKTWDFTVPTAVPPGINDRPWLALGKDILYLYVNHVTHTQVYSSTDGALTWTSDGPLTYNGSSSGQPYFPGHIAADRRGGRLWVAGLVAQGGSKRTLASTVSSDGGSSFSESVITEPQREGGFSPIFTGTTAVDRAGNGYVTWSTWDKDGCDLYYASSTNKGKSWNRPVKVNTGRGCATFPWIAASGRGQVAIAYYQTPGVSRGSGDDLVTTFLRAATAGRTVYGGIEVELENYQDNLPPDAPWYLHVAMVRNAHTQKPKVSSARVPTEAPVLEGSMGRELWDFLMVDIGPDGRLHVAYAEKYSKNAPQTWYVASRTRF